MDLKSFSNDEFNPKEWINQTYKLSNKNETKQDFVQNTLNALQLYMQQLNNSLEETSSQIMSSLPRVMGESIDIKTGAEDLRSLAENLEDALTAAQEAAGQPLLTLQRTDRLKAVLEAARQELQEKNNWASLTRKLETALESQKSFQLSNVTDIMENLNGCLELLSDSADYEDKRLQLEGLKNRLEAFLSASIVQAFTTQSSAYCKDIWKLFVIMDRKNALSVYRARCEHSNLRSRLPSGVLNLSPSSMRDLHTTLLRHATQQLGWAATVLPGEETLPWLIRFYSSVLSELTNAKQLDDFDNKTMSGASQLDQLTELIAACDHFMSEMFMIIRKDQEIQKANISESDLAEFAFVVYAPIRNNYDRLNRLIVSAMNDDLGPTPNVEPQISDVGTTLQLRIARGSRTLASRLTQGKIISRGAAPQHLVYAAQWLIDELCSGWSSVNNLAGCLSLMKAAAHLQSLVTQANNILNDTEDNSLQEKMENLPEVFKNWKVLLKPNFIPIISSAPLSTSSEKLCKDLKLKAFDLVLSPIAGHLECINKIQGWSDNDQHALELPDFSLSPQEYITQVGQYLMNLPQHLEPLLERGEVSTTEEDPAYVFLNEVCNAACEMFIKKINSVERMDALGVRKCVTDVAYLSSVLEELEAGTAGVQLLTELIAKKQAS